MRLITAKEYAKLNFLSISLVRKLIKLKKLRSKKIKRRVYIWID